MASYPEWRKALNKALAVNNKCFGCNIRLLIAVETDFIRIFGFVAMNTRTICKFSGPSVSMQVLDFYRSFLLVNRSR